MRSRLSKGGAYAPSLPLLIYLIRHYTDQNHMRLLIVLLFLTLLSYWQFFLELVDLEALSLSFVLFLSVKQLENGLFCGKVIDIHKNSYIPRSVPISRTLSLLSDSVSTPWDRAPMSGKGHIHGIGRQLSGSLYLCLSTMFYSSDNRDCRREEND